MDIKEQIHGLTEEMLTNLGRLVAIDSQLGTPAEGKPFGEGPAKALEEGLKAHLFLPDLQPKPFPFPARQLPHISALSDCRQPRIWQKISRIHADNPQCADNPAAEASGFPDYPV